jgi:hypothetical protein
LLEQLIVVDLLDILDAAFGYLTRRTEHRMNFSEDSALSRRQFCHCFFHQ